MESHVENELRSLYHYAIKTRTVYHTQRALKRIIESEDLSPSVEFLTNNAIECVQLCGSLPCLLTIMPGLLLRKTKKDGTIKHRFFYSSLQCTIPRGESFRLSKLNQATKQRIYKKIAAYDYMEELSHYRDNSKWKFVGVMCVTYMVQRMF